MFTRTILSMTTLAALSTSAIAGAPTVTFAPIPDALSADDMSPDGRWVVGYTDVNGNGFPDGLYRWDAVNDVFTDLPAPGTSASAISDDGSVVLGNMEDPTGIGTEVAAIWTAAGGWQSLDALPNACSGPMRSSGWELSGDGNVATGFSFQDGCQAYGFIWTQATGMQELELLANGTNRASVISTDGSVIGGFAQGSFSRTPAIWDASGAGQLLDPPNGDALGEVYGMSDDGSVLLGSWNGDAVMWDAVGVRTVIGNGQMIAGWDGLPFDIADDGTIVGFDFLPGPGARRAWIKPPTEPTMRLLSTFITAQGGTVPAGTNLEVCQAISTDGRFIVGHSFGTGAWRVTIDNGTCDGDLNGDDNVGFADLNQVLTAWGPCPGCPEDLDGDGNVGFSDLNTVLTAWGPCP